jgi:hypothetical protein
MKRISVGCIAGILACTLLFPAVALAKFGIEPGKVYIDNLYPGAEADVPITIYNQNDYTTTFLVRACQPDYTETGYEPFPHLDWISIRPEQVTINAHENSEVMVVIIMPEDARYSGKKAEVWVRFKEQEEPGSGKMIQIEIATRLLISTRVEEEAEPTKPEAVTVQPAEETEPIKPGAVTVQPTEETEPTKPGAVTVQPAVEGGGEVGITAEGGRNEEGASRFPWVVVGPVLGLIAVIGILFFLRQARQRT